jgi:hypothetical protein
MEQRQDDYIIGPGGQMGKMKKKCILYFYMNQGYTQVSDVAHGPLVFFKELWPWKGQKAILYIVK